MNSNDIRRAIREGFEHETRTQNVAKVLNALPLSQQARTECLAFIRAYVQETPDLMDAAFEGARTAGLTNQIQPLFDAAFGYWAKPQDLIPNHLGLIGLTDDAYLTHSLMDQVSARHQQETGRPLFSLDLQAANQAMRNIIGEPVATLLDQIVVQTVGGPSIQGVLQQLLTLGMSLPPAGYPGALGRAQLERARIDDEVDIRLGAMGVV